MAVVSTDWIIWDVSEVSVSLYDIEPRSCGWELPGRILFSSILGFRLNLDELSLNVSELSDVSMSWNLTWLSAWIFDNLLESLSSLKFISSNLFVNSLNCPSSSDNLSKCIVRTTYPVPITITYIKFLKLIA